MGAKNKMVSLHRVCSRINGFISHEREFKDPKIANKYVSEWKKRGSTYDSAIVAVYSRIEVTEA